MGKETLDSFGFFKKKEINRTYISKRLFNSLPDGSRRALRIVSKVIDSSEFFTHKRIKHEVVLRKTPGGRQEIIAKVYEDTKGVFVLSFQKYTVENGNPHELSFSFIADEIRTLKNFIDSLKFLDFSRPDKSRVEDEQSEKVREFYSKNPDLFIEIVQKDITKRDVVTLAYRKKQLKIFDKLLSDGNYFLIKKQDWEKTKDEDVWQEFFEKNPWIFGYGLRLIFNEPLQNRKLQQVVSGFAITGAGKRIDGLLKTRGIVNSFCLVEVKTNKTELLKQVNKAYRPDCWQLSDDFNGGIAQIPKTTQKTLENIGTKLNPRLKDGTPTGEEIYLYQPKSYLIVGSLSEFETEQGINKEKYSSFELFRQNIINPEIITFDELYERAKFIVYNNERMAE